MEGGYISLHRKIREHWIWGDETYLKWWIDLLMLVNHEPQKKLISGKPEIIDVGEHHTTESILSERWFASRTKVVKFLNLLVSDGMIELKKSRQNGTTIKIRNYQAYQAKNDSKKTTNDTTKEQRKNNHIMNNNNSINNISSEQVLPAAEPCSAGERPDEKKGNSSLVELDGDDIFEKVYKLYPKKQGKSDGKSAFINYLTTGRKLKGQGTVRLNHLQIAYAIRHYAAEVANTDEEFIKQFGTFMGSQNGKHPILDYADYSRPVYEAAMLKNYGDNWGKTKFKYNFKGVKAE